MTERQDELLAKHDGRYFVIDKFNTGLAVLVTAEKLGKKGQVDFAVPSSPALFLNAARRSYAQIKDDDPEKMLYRWQNGRIPINHSVLFDYFEAFVSHVVFSFTALEAFANEAIPNDFEYEIEKKGEKILLKKPDIERNVNLDEKLDFVLPKALGDRIAQENEALAALQAAQADARSHYPSKSNRPVTIGGRVRKCLGNDAALTW